MRGSGRSAVRVALWYTIFGVAWILITDLALSQLAPAPSAAMQVAILKGSLFVLASAGLIYLLMRRELKRRQETERGLADLRTRLATVLEVTTDFVGIADSGGRALFVNRAGRELLGMTADEPVVGLPIATFHPAWAARIIADEAVPTAVAEGVWRGEAALLARDGREIPVSQIVLAHRSEDGAVEFVSTVARDLSERVRAEEALRRSEELLSTAFRLIPMPAAIAAADGSSLINVNRAFLELVGLDRDEVIGRSVFELNIWVDPEQRREIGRQILSGEPVRGLEVEIRGFGGEVRSGHFFAERLDIGGEPSLLGIFHDITDQRRAEEQLRQAQKMEAVGQLAGGVAHDFNNLLTTIMGCAQLGLAECDEGSPIRHELEEIVAASKRAASLTRQLLAFSRREVTRPQVLNLNELLVRMEKMLARLIGEDVELITRLDPDLGPIHADPGQIEQVVMNLAINARDAMPEGGRLTLKTRRASRDEIRDSEAAGLEHGEYALLSVSDTGIGMSAATRERIFEPFFTTKERGRGTGLGLATVYGIVQQTDGHVEVKSERGRGTTLRVFFPLAEAGVTSETREPVPSQSGGSETVLVVEDDTAIRTLCRTVLRRQGYEVLEAASGRQALDLCGRRNAPIHLLITDIVMPEISGRELADEFARMHPEAGILFISGYADDRLLQWGPLDQEIDLLQKPFSPTELTERVRKALERRAAG